MSNLMGNIILVILSLVIFFALYPVVDAILGTVLDDVTNTSDTVIFLMSSVGFVMLLGMFKWVFNAVAGEV